MRKLLNSQMCIKILYVIYRIILNLQHIIHSNRKLKLNMK